MHVDGLELLLPPGGSAQQSAHMFDELRSLGYSLAVGWRCEPLACGDAAIYSALLDAAGGDDTSMTDEELASFQAWRRAAKVLWASDSDWRSLTLSERDLDSSWDFVLSGVPPSFVLRNVQGDSGSDDDSTDATTADGTHHIVTPNDTFGYSEDWNHIERSSRPTHAAVNLLH